MRGCLPWWNGFQHSSLGFTSLARVEQSAARQPSASFEGTGMEPSRALLLHFHSRQARGALSWPAQPGGDVGGEQNHATSLHLHNNSQETH